MMGEDMAICSRMARGPAGRKPSFLAGMAWGRVKWVASRHSPSRHPGLDPGSRCLFQAGTQKESGTPDQVRGDGGANRSEEHTSELQSLMRSSYAVFCLKKKNIQRKIRGKQI